MKQFILICLLILISSCGKNKKYHNPQIQENPKIEAHHPDDINMPDLEIKIEAASLISKNNNILRLNVINRSYILEEDATMKGIAKSIFNIHHTENNYYPLKSLAKLQFLPNSNLVPFTNEKIDMIKVKLSFHYLSNLNHLRIIKFNLSDISGKDICQMTLNPRAVLDTQEINHNNYKNFKNIELPCYITIKNATYEHNLKDLKPFYFNLSDVEYLEQGEIQSLKKIYDHVREKNAILFMTLPEKNSRFYLNDSKTILESLQNNYVIKINSDNTIESLNSFISYPLASFYNKDFFKQGHWFNINPYSTNIIHPTIAGSIYHLMYKKRNEFQIEHLNLIDEQNYELTRTFKSERDNLITLTKSENEISQIVFNLEQELFNFETNKLEGQFKYRDTPREGYRYGTCKFYYKKITDSTNLNNTPSILQYVEIQEKNKWISVFDSSLVKIVNSESKTELTIPQGITQIQIRLKPRVKNDYVNYKFMKYASGGNSSCRGEKYKSLSVQRHNKIEKGEIPKEKTLKAAITVKQWGFRF
jgi:hypothetical protein